MEGEIEASRGMLRCVEADVEVEASCGKVRLRLRRAEAEDAVS